jgi:acyl carrier protein
MGGNDSDTTTTAWDSGFEDVLRPHLPYAGGRALRPDDALADLGLDSLEVINLLLDIEGTYGLAFPDEMLTAETFATVGSLWDAVAAVAAEQGGG